MKKIITLAIMALICATSASAQDKGNWGVGPKLSLYTNAGTTVVGIGAVGRYSFTDNWRLEPAFTALLHKGCSIDLSIDIQYIFDLGEGWKVYPLAGVSLNQINRWAAGINIGGAVDYELAHNWDLTAGVKWQPMFSSFRRNPIIISLGAIYKF